MLPSRSLVVVSAIAFALWMLGRAEWTKALNAEFIVLGQTSTTGGTGTTGTSSTGTTGVGAGTISSFPFLRKWPDSSFPIPWRLNVTKGANIEGTRSLLDVVRAAFQSWSAIDTAVVTFQESASIPATDPGFDRINHMSAVPTSYSSDALALTMLYSFNSTGLDPLGRKIEFPGQIVEADIVYSPTALFSVDVTTPGGRIDLESVAVHEIGHFLGLDHTAISSAAMFPTLAKGVNYGRIPSMADRLLLSRLYPASALFVSRGGLSGIVRTSSGAGVFGAHVVVIDSAGRPVVSTFTDYNGSYQVTGLPSGSYSAFVEPLDGPVSSNSIADFAQHFPGHAAFTGFSTRLAVPSAAPTLTISKTAGDNQSGDMGEQLAELLEVKITDGSGNPMPGVTVYLSGTSGGATVVPFIFVTDTLGTLRARVYLGSGLTQSVTVSAGPAQTTFTATVRPPVLASLSSNSGTRGAEITQTLTGKNFVKGATSVAVSGSGVIVTGVTVINSTTLAAIFNIAATADATTRAVTVSGPNGASDPRAFTVQ